MKANTGAPDLDAHARCAACGYLLTGLPSPGACPECGRSFDLADASTFLTHDPFMRWRYWMPGLVSAALILVIGLALGVFVFGAWTWSIWIATPVAAATLAGYGTRVRRWFEPLMLILFLGGTFIGAIVSLDLGGAFCGMILAVILLVPLTAGIILGSILRGILKGSSFRQRWYLPLLALFLLCGLYQLDGPPRLHAAETVVTERCIAVSAEEGFDSLRFFEEVRQPPPWLLRIGLVRPHHASGSCAAVGDVKVCVYDRGRIVKRVAAVEPDRRLDFVIVEQDIGYEHDVTLTGGSFEFIPVGTDACIIRLTTAYVPRLGPRFCWRWGERIGVHVLHNHVIDAIESEARRRNGGLALPDHGRMTTSASAAPRVARDRSAAEVDVGGSP